MIRMLVAVLSDCRLDESRAVLCPRSSSRAIGGLVARKRFYFIDRESDRISFPSREDEANEKAKPLVDDLVTLPEDQIFDAVVWVMSHLKVVPGGAAAAPVGALLQGLIDLPRGTKVCCVLSGGNVNPEQLRAFDGIETPTTPKFQLSM